jgi:hypothetical protein
MSRKQEKPQNPASYAVPVTLPLVVATVLNDQSIQITVNGELLVQGPIDRASLGRVLSAIAEDRRSAIRAEVHESDGRVFVDIITPPVRRSRFAPPPNAPVIPNPPALVEVSGVGFVPGEDVAIAIITSRTSATGDGFARALLERTKIPGSVTEVLLFGETSGTVVRQERAR